MNTPTPNPFEISIPDHLLANDTLSEQPKKPTDSAQEEAELKAVLAQARQQSMEIDMSGLDLGTAPTMLRPSTPAPAMPVTPAPVVATDDPPPALYEDIRIRLEPSMVAVGTPVRVVMLGVKTNGDTEEVADMSLSTMKCDPEDGGAFTFGVFTPSKEGTLTIYAALADAGGSKIHHAPTAKLTVNAADKVEFSDSMQNVVSPAAKPIAEAAAKPLTLSDTPAEQEFFHGKKPRAMTEGGSRIYPPLPPIAPEPVARPSHDVLVSLEAVSARRVWWSQNWKRFVLVTIGLLFCGRLAFGATIAFLTNGHGLTTIEVPSTPSAPEAAATVTDTSVEPEVVIPVTVPTVIPTEPGLTGTPGRRVTMSARAAFPVSCLTGWSTARTDGIHFFCAPSQRHGDDVCDCTVAGVVPR